MALPKYAPKSTREAHEQEIADLEMMVNPSSSTALDSSRFVDPGKINPRKAAKRLEEEKARLRAVSPKRLTDRQRMQTVERLKLLETAMVKGNAESDIPAMPSKQQQWNASDSDVSQNIGWQEFWKQHNLKPNGGVKRIDKRTEQGAIWEWMDLRREVLTTQDRRGDPGVASVESMRPDERLDTARRSIHAPFANITFEQYNAIMGGKSALSKVQFQVLEAESEGRATVRTPEQSAPAHVRGEAPAVCGAPTKSGEPCGMRVSKEGDRCINHAEEETDGF